MNVRLTKLALLAILAGAPWAACDALAQQAAPSRPGQQLIRAAAEKMAYRTVESRVRVHTNLLGQPLVGTGEYAQFRSSAGLLLRLELSIQSGSGQVTSVKQISDGRDLWEHWRLGETERLNHVDLRRVEAVIKQSSGQSLAVTTATLATGGLPKLLKQLDANFDFDRAAIQKTQIGQLPVWLVVGEWRPEQLAKADPLTADAGHVDLDQLPDHLPHRVKVWLGMQDWFPYRITYDRLESKDGGSISRPAVTTEFFEVAVEADVDPSQFYFRQPQNVGVVDRTDAFLQSLGIGVNQDVATRPARQPQ